MQLVHTYRPFQQFHQMHLTMFKFLMRNQLNWFQTEFQSWWRLVEKWLTSWVQWNNFIRNECESKEFYSTRNLCKNTKKDKDKILMKNQNIKTISKKKRKKKLKKVMMKSLNQLKTWFLKIVLFSKRSLYFRHKSLQFLTDLVESW